MKSTVRLTLCTFSFLCVCSLASSQAQAFELLDRLLGGGGYVDSGCCASKSGCCAKKHIVRRSCGCDHGHALKGHVQKGHVQKGCGCGHVRKSCGCGHVRKSCGCGHVRKSCGVSLFRKSCGCGHVQKGCGCGHVRKSCGCGLFRKSCGCDHGSCKLGGKGDGDYYKSPSDLVAPSPIQDDEPFQGGGKIDGKTTLRTPAGIVDPA